jgi:transcriptional regulator with XRE-family HTH domain
MAKSERAANVKLAGELMKAAKAGEDLGLTDLMAEVRARLNKPMADILRKVPGATVKARAERIGVSRQAYYDWLKGLYRPTGQQSKRLQRLTGIPAEVIRGKGEVPRRRHRKASAVAATSA